MMQNRVETAWGERNLGGEDLKGTIEHHTDRLGRKITNCIFQGCT